MKRPKMVIFGAGSIGRSFVAPVFARSDFQIVFVDISKEIVRELNLRNSYRVVEKQDGKPDRESVVSPVRGVLVDDTEAVGGELRDARLAATAVGESAFDSVIGSIARAAATRSEPLDIVLAENIHHAGTRARTVMQEKGLDLGKISGAFGFVESSIGKMVPVMPSAIRKRDPLLCWAEPYNTLIVDRDGFRNPIPDVADLFTVAPIEPWVDRKLYIHNLGHAAASYLGFVHNPEAEYLWEVLQTSSVSSQVHAAMTRSAEALRCRYPDAFTRGELADHVEDLIARFRSRALGDTIHRVGRDLRRKLHRDDRVVGAIRMAMSAGLDPAPLLTVFASAVRFRKRPADGEQLQADREFVSRFDAQGVNWILDEVVQVKQDETELRSLLEKALKS